VPVFSSLVTLDWALQARAVLTFDISPVRVSPWKDEDAQFLGSAASDSLQNAPSVKSQPLPVQMAKMYSFAVTGPILLVL